MKTFTIKIGKGPDEMTFDECMAHIKRVLFWDYIDGEWCDVVPLSDKRWEELAGYIRGAHEREVDTLKAENAKLRHALKNSVNCRKFGGCFVCPQFHEHAQYDAMCDNDMLMHELGIEAES